MSGQAVAGFELFAVTADQGIRAWGQTLPELFRQAARGLFSLIVEAGTVENREWVPVSATAGDRETLLVAWLNELLYLYETRALVMGEWRIRRLEDTALEAEAGGEAVDAARHALLGHVKAVTYHGLALYPTERGWEARVVVDV
ncbi:MAG: archease [candidate division NC10 bacterium]|nr:archease [candidate division NC10 bacterium]